MKAVLMDFNGTLFFDTPFHIRAWHSFFQKELGRDLSEEEIRRRCIGPGNDDIFRDFFGNDVPVAQKAIWAKAKEAEYRAAVLDDPKNKALRKGVPEFLDYLVAHDVPYILATASPLENVQFYLDDLGLNRWFTLDTVVFDEGKLACKPDPAFYLESARRLGVDPADCLIAEDSPTGIRAAVRAGAGRIVALGGTTPPEALAAFPELYAVVDDFCGFERFLV